MADAEDKLPLKEVARQLGRSLEQVRRYVREGKLPAEKLGMQWFVERGALEAFTSTRGGATKQDVLARAWALQERIRKRVGWFNVVELVEESRRNHPFEVDYPESFDFAKDKLRRRTRDSSRDSAQSNP
jgi:excisionase family DNA binding protein